MENFVLAIRLNCNDKGENGDYYWAHIYKISCDGVESLGRATDENVAAVQEKYPDVYISKFSEM